jgi:hypothetical protein
LGIGLILAIACTAILVSWCLEWLVAQLQKGSTREERSKQWKEDEMLFLLQQVLRHKRKIRPNIGVEIGHRDDIELAQGAAAQGEVEPGENDALIEEARQNQEPNPDRIARQDSEEDIEGVYISLVRHTA